MGISPFFLVELFIRVLLLGSRLFYIYIYIYENKYYKYCCCIRAFFNVIKVLLVYNPNYSFCFPPGWYHTNLVLD